jgi:hypothetical protein
MSDSKLNFKINERVEFRPHILDEDETPFNGVIEEIHEDLLHIRLPNGELRKAFFWDCEKYVDPTLLNEREKLKYDYRRWVNDYTESLDKIHVTMDEVQSKYSQLAISFAISELSKVSEITTDGKTRLRIEDRIKHLQSLIG